VVGEFHALYHGLVERYTEVLNQSPQDFAAVQQLEEGGL
jgi:hypothetical protein